MIKFEVDKEDEKNRKENSKKITKKMQCLKLLSTPILLDELV